MQCFLPSFVPQNLHPIHSFNSHLLNAHSVTVTAYIPVRETDNKQTSEIYGMQSGKFYGEKKIREGECLNSVVMEVLPEKIISEGKAKRYEE